MRGSNVCVNGPTPARPHKAPFFHGTAIRFPWIPTTAMALTANPVIHADYSDPDVIRQGADFWMVPPASIARRACRSCIPTISSTGPWNHALRQVPHPRYAEISRLRRLGSSIRFHDSRFWVFFPMPDEGVFVTTATDPAGRWSEPWLLQEAKGWIDPCPFWDNDGRPT